MNIGPDAARYLLALLIAVVACGIASIVLHRLFDALDQLSGRLGTRRSQRRSK